MNKPTTGLGRYLKLIKNVSNPIEYIGDKITKAKRFKGDLNFTTKPYPIRFNVPASLYLVFKEIFLSDVYSIKELASSLPAKPTIIDIGANVGYFDILILSKVEKATIYAYEPIASNIEFLKNAMQENTILKESIVLEQKAVTGVAVESINMYAENTDANQVVASSIQGFNKDNTKIIKIPAITLTEIIKNAGTEKIDLLKMDCEGSEYDIIYNTPVELVRCIDKMAIEVHNIDNEKNNIQAFDNYLNQIGYATEYYPINGFCFALEATKRTN